MAKPLGGDLRLPNYEEIRGHADKLLRQASAYGRFPTPVDDLVAAAKLEVDPTVSLDEGFVARIRRGLREGVFKRAVAKVVGLLDRRDKKIYLDLGSVPARRSFVSIHEVGHDFLYWQRDTYRILEDDRASLDPEVQEDFEREASVFASEVLFQCDGFDNECHDRALELKTPINLASKYSASCYAGVWRFVSSNRRVCAVFVFDPPVYSVGAGYDVRLRRTLESESFLERYGKLPAEVGDHVKQIVIAATAKKTCFVESRMVSLSFGGEELSCRAEAFNSSYQVFVLIIPQRVPAFRLTTIASKRLPPRVSVP